MAVSMSPDEHMTFEVSPALPSKSPNALRGGDMRDAGTASLLLNAVQAQDVALIERLLVARADPDAADGKGVRPLHAATFDGNKAVIRVLIAARADPNVRDRHGQTPIFFAGDARACETLAKARADPNILNKKGQSALHLACHAGLTDVVTWLTENSSPGILDVQDKHGRTAMYCAKHSNAAESAAILQRHGANTKIQPHRHWHGKSPSRRTVAPPGNQVMTQAISTATKLNSLVASQPSVLTLTPAAPAPAPPPPEKAKPTAMSIDVPVQPTQAVATDKSMLGKSLSADFEPISPKRPDPHLMDEPQFDEEVCALLEGSLGAGGEQQEEQQQRGQQLKEQRLRELLEQQQRDKDVRERKQRELWEHQQQQEQQMREQRQRDSFEQQQRGRDLHEQRQGVWERDQREKEQRDQGLQMLLMRQRQQLEQQEEQQEQTQTPGRSEAVTRVLDLEEHKQRPGTSEAVSRMLDLEECAEELGVAGPAEAEGEAPPLPEEPSDAERLLMLEEEASKLAGDDCEFAKCAPPSAAEEESVEAALSLGVRSRAPSVKSSPPTAAQEDHVEAALSLRGGSKAPSRKSSLPSAAQEENDEAPLVLRVMSSPASAVHEEEEDDEAAPPAEEPPKLPMEPPAPPAAPPSLPRSGPCVDEDEAELSAKCAAPMASDSPPPSLPEPEQPSLAEGPVAKEVVFAEPLAASASPRSFAASAPPTLVDVDDAAAEVPRDDFSRLCSRDVATPATVKSMDFEEGLLGSQTLDAEMFVASLSEQAIAEQDLRGSACAVEDAESPEQPAAFGVPPSEPSIKASSLVLEEQAEEIPVEELRTLSKNRLSYELQATCDLELLAAEDAAHFDLPSEAGDLMQALDEEEEAMEGTPGAAAEEPEASVKSEPTLFPLVSMTVVENEATERSTAAMKPTASDDFGEDDDGEAAGADSKCTDANRDIDGWHVESQEPFQLQEESCTLTILTHRQQGLIRFEALRQNAEPLYITCTNEQFDGLVSEQVGVSGPAKVIAATRQLFREAMQTMEEEVVPAVEPLVFERHRPLKAPIGEPVKKEDVDGCLRWEVTLRKEDAGQKYGFTHVREEMVTKLPAEALFVRRVFDEGLIPQWNQNHPDASVQPTDRIISVNGVTVPKDMQAELRKPSVNIVVVRYPERFLVHVAAGEGVGPSRLGMVAVLPPDFETPHKKQLLQIRHVRADGPLDEWNKRQIAQGTWQFVVSPGMYVEAVNQVTGDANSMMAELDRRIPAGTVEIRVKRAELARCAIEKCRKRAYVVLQWERGLKITSPSSAGALSPMPATSSSGFPPPGRSPASQAPALPGMVNTGETQERSAAPTVKALSKEELAKIEKREEKDWATAMEKLQRSNRTRGARSSKDIDSGVAGVTMKDYCELWDMQVEKTPEAPRLGFAFTSGLQEFQKARRELAHEMQGPQTLLVKKLADDGAAAVWNRTHSSLELLPCDHINAVDGVEDIEGIKQALRKQKQVRVQVMRYPQFFVVDLRRGLAGAPAGAIPEVGMTYEACATSAAEESVAELLVTGVEPRGLLERWNQRNIAQGLYHFVVLPGMRIQAVDGVEGNTAAMAQELGRGKAQRLLIRRGDVGNMARAKVTRTMNALKNMGVLHGGLSKALTPAK